MTSTDSTLAPNGPRSFKVVGCGALQVLFSQSKPSRIDQPLKVGTFEDTLTYIYI